MRVILECLNVFATADGTKVSCDKTQVFFSKGVNHNVSSRIISMAGPRTSPIGDIILGS